MASFELQVEGITSLTIDGSSAPTTTELAQFIADGVLEVTSRCISAKPSEIINFQKASAESESTITGVDSQIISVVRESGTNNQWRPCTMISPGSEHLVVDKDSLYYASKFNPVYMIGDNNTITVFPSPEAGGSNSIKAYYVNNVAVDATSSAAITAAHADIKYFPKSKVYMVVLYASIKSLENFINSNTLSLITTTSNIPNSPVISQTSQSLPTYTDPAVILLPSAPIAPIVNLSTMSITGTAPNYIAPVLSLSITPVISNLTVNAVAPSLDSLSLISATPIGLSSAPTYISPVLSLDSKPTITDLTINSIIPVAPVLSDSALVTAGLTDPTLLAPVMNPPDWASTNTLISTNEDSEMASSRVQEIQAKIQEYSARMQESQAVFTKESTILQKDLQIATQNLDSAHKDEASKLSKYSSEISAYQASVAKEVQEWTANYQADFQCWDTDQKHKLQEYQLNVQNALNVFNKENTEYQMSLNEDIQNTTLNLQKDQRNISKYQAQVATHQVDVNKEVQSYELNLKADMDLWYQERQTDLGKYNADIQSSLNSFNKENTEYQAKLQKDVQNAQLSESKEGREIQKYTQELQSYQAEIQKSVQKYQSDLSFRQSNFKSSMDKYTAELQKVSSDNQTEITKFNSEIQKYASVVQEDNANIQLAINRLDSLRKQYTESFLLMYPQQKESNTNKK